MAIVQVPIIDATGATRQVDYYEGPGGVLRPLSPKENDGSDLRVVAQLSGSVVAKPLSTEVWVGDRSVVVLPENNGRSHALLTNAGTTAVMLSLGGVATESSGLRLDAGEKLELSSTRGNLFRGAISAVRSGRGPQPLLVVEGVAA